jgi:hypothetical protein
MDKEIEKLAASWINGELNEKESFRLLEECKADPELLDKIAELQEMDRMLQTIPVDSEKNCDEIVMQLEGNIPDSSGKVISILEKQQIRKRQQIVYTFLAAAAVFCLWFFYPKEHSAIITAALETGPQFRVRSKIHNESYTFKNGYLCLRFNSGAEVIIEGPAKFKIKSDMEIFLEEGKIVADVPKSAHGFKINTDNTSTIDLGTRFAVEAKEGGSAEIHVIEGLVKSKSIKAKDYQELKATEALKVDENFKEKRTTADSGKFLTSLPPDAPVNKKFILWRFDEQNGSASESEGTGFEQNYSAELKSIGTKLPKRVQGKYGNALNFDGKSNYVETEFPGIGGDHARTVSFWVKAEPNFKSVNGYAIISWGSFEHYGATWQISLNPQKEDGPLGRLRCGTHRGQIIGSTDLRDGKWHHISVIMYGGPDADVSTHLLIYVDGILEKAARKSIRKINTDINSESAVKVHIAQNAAAIKNPQIKNRFFKGGIDEVYVFNYALSASEVRMVMANQPIFSNSK